jgi:hypothetical protein
MAPIIAAIFCFNLAGAKGGIRTLTVVRPLDPESKLAGFHTKL